jgi:hypothetical protein
MLDRVREWFVLRPTERVLVDVWDERQRQEERWPGQTLAGPQMTDVERLAIVAEEHGEVARGVCELTWPPDTRRPDAAARQHLRVELVQLAACCVAWAEAIDEQAGAAGF